jgi:pimeloyl-ACP methyl ester carboxylesterase
MIEATIQEGVKERPIFFSAAGETLFGVLCEPMSGANGIGVVLVQGGDTVNVSFHRNRLAVRLARRLAEGGYTSLRFDYHGLGESSGEVTQFHVHDPLTADAAAAALLLDELGCPNIVLIGACFSARTVLAAAPAIKGLRAIVMVTPPIGGHTRQEAASEQVARERTWGEFLRTGVRWRVLVNLGRPAHRKIYLRFVRSKLRRTARMWGQGPKVDRSLYWVSPMFLDALAALVDLGTPALVVFGEQDPLLREWHRASFGRLGRILDDPRGHIEVVENLPGVVHAFTNTEGQESFLDLAIRWIDDTTNKATSTP